MALLFCDSMPYDSANFKVPKRWTQILNPAGGTLNYCSIQSPGPFGGNYMQLGIHTTGSGTGPLCYVKKTLDVNCATMMAQFHYYPLQTTMCSQILVGFFDTVSQNQCYISQFGGVLRARRGNAYPGALLGTSTQTISVAWHAFEVKVTFSPTVGTILVKVDGVEFLNLSGLNNIVSANAYANTVLFGYSDADGYNAQVYGAWSDIIVMDTTGSYCNDLLGPRQVKQLMPTANGYYTDWTPSTGGNHAALVDEVPPSEADYNATAVVNNKDTFTFDDLTNANAVIDAVVCTMYAKTDDAGAAKLKGTVRSNSDDADGTEQAVPASSNFLSSPIYVDPDTGVPFTAAGFNAAEFGYKRSA